MNPKAFLFNCVLLFLAVPTLSLSCVGTCSTCTPVNELGCKGGTVPDDCGCCDKCAKVAGEVCGGPWDMMGKCDEGLRCDISDPNDFNSSGKCVELEEIILPPLEYW